MINTGPSRNQNDSRMIISRCLLLSNAEQHVKLVYVDASSINIAVFAFVSTFVWLLVARALSGVASACISVAGMGMVARLYGGDEDETRSRVMGYVLGGIATGVLVGYPMGGFLYDFVGKPAPFIIISGAALALTGLNELPTIHFTRNEMRCHCLGFAGLQVQEFWVEGQSLKVVSTTFQTNYPWASF